MASRLDSFVQKFKQLFQTFATFFQDLWCFRKTLIIVFAPLLFMPLIVWTDNKDQLALEFQKSRCLFVVIIMAIFWVTEALPLAITALLPLFLFPVLGVLSAKKVAREYIQDPTFLFIGSFLIAIAIEKADIHHRLAMKAILIVGANPKCILMALMAVSAFLSMWMSNTATTAMMLPIVEAILVELVKDKRGPSAEISEPFLLNPQRLSMEELNLCKMMFLSICYSSNIGGIATLTGTATNVVALGILERRYGENIGVTFASWMGFAVPLTIVNLIFSWFLLLLFFNGFKNSFLCRHRSGTSNTTVMEGIRSNYALMGPLNFRQILVSVLFLIVVLLWAFREPKVIPGWGDLFPSGYISDSTTAIFVAFLLFIFPTCLPDFLCFKTRNIRKAPEIREALLDWQSVQSKFPWGLIFLMGGGFAMAAAIEESGLSDEIGKALSSLSYLSAVGICVVAAIFATFATEITTNMGVVTVLTPILNAVAEKLEINPLYFALTITVCASYAFMLPTATPPNAVVFGYGYVRVIDMIKIGFFLNWFAIAITMFAMNTWAWWLFDIGRYPTWARGSNYTAYGNTHATNASFL